MQIIARFKSNRVGSAHTHSEDEYIVVSIRAQDFSPGSFIALQCKDEILNSHALTPVISDHSLVDIWGIQTRLVEKLTGEGISFIVNRISTHEGNNVISRNTTASKHLIGMRNVCVMVVAIKALATSHQHCPLITQHQTQQKEQSHCFHFTQNKSEDRLRKTLDKHN